MANGHWSCLSVAIATLVIQVIYFKQWSLDSIQFKRIINYSRFQQNGQPSHWSSRTFRYPADDVRLWRFQVLDVEGKSFFPVRFLFLKWCKIFHYYFYLFHKYTGVYILNHSPLLLQENHLFSPLFKHSTVKNQEWRVNNQPNTLNS